MIARKEITYEIEPGEMGPGDKFIRVKIKNTSDSELTDLNVRLNSMDTYNITIIDYEGENVGKLERQAEVEFSFRVLAYNTGHVYISVNGKRNSESFYFESAPIRISVGVHIAEISRFYAMSEHTKNEKRLVLEASLAGFNESHNLVLEFWDHKPDGEVIEVYREKISELKPGEKMIITTQLDTDEEGVHNLLAYLYDGTKRIDMKTETAHV